MKKKNRIVLCGIMTLIMAFVMTMPVSVSATEDGNVAKIGEIEYATLKDAVDDVGENQTIVVLRDSIGDGIVVPSGKNFTIDFNGHRYTVNQNLVGSTGTENNGFQLLKDSTITMKNGIINSDYALILIQNYSNLTLENMDLSSTKADYVLSNNNGNVNIIGDTSITAKDGAVAFDVCYYANYPSVRVNVNTEGVITGNIELSKSANRADEAQNCSLNISNITLNGKIMPDGDVNIPTTVTGGEFSNELSKDYLTNADVTATYVKDGTTVYLVGKTTIEEKMNSVTEGTFTITKAPEDFTIAAPKDGVTLVNESGLDIVVGSGAESVVVGNGKEYQKPETPSQPTTTPGNEQGTTGTEAAGDSAKTGDDFNMTAVIAIMGIAAAAAAGTIVYGRRKRSN